MTEPLQLSITQRFEIERMNRAIDSTVDTEQLKQIAKQLLQAWQSQRAATAWAIKSRLL